METLIKPRPNHDVFGHCVLCHDNLLKDIVIDGKVRTVFGPNHGEISYKLDDGSTMRVCMCKACQEDCDGTEYDYVMKSVVDGWKHEVNTYSHWSDEKRTSYIEEYSKKVIVVRDDNKPKDVVEKHLNDFKKDKGKGK